MDEADDPLDDSKYQFQFRPEFSRLNQDRDLAWVVPLRVRYILAIVGARWSGKSVLQTYLSEQHGFRIYSLSHLLRMRALHDGIPIGGRRMLQHYGNSLRADAQDPALLAYQAMRAIRRDWLGQRPRGEPMPRIAVSGFKNPYELRALITLTRLHPVVIEIADARRRRRVETDELESQLTPEELAAIPKRRRFEAVDRLDSGAGLSEFGIRPHPLDCVGEAGQSSDAVARLARTSCRCAVLRNDIDGPRKPGALFEQTDAFIAELDRRYRAIEDA